MQRFAFDIGGSVGAAVGAGMAARLCCRRQVGVFASLPTQSGTYTVIVMEPLALVMEPLAVEAEAVAGAKMKARAATARAIVLVRFVMLSFLQLRRIAAANGELGPS
jgi:hypothetical protein